MNATKRSLSGTRPGAAIRHLGDFTTNPRVLFIAAIAVVVGIGGVISGVILLQLIRLVTNIAYFGAFTLADLKPGALAARPVAPCWCRWSAR